MATNNDVHSQLNNGLSVQVYNEQSCLLMEKRMRNSYQSAIDKLQKELDDFYAKYAKENKIDLQVAKQNLSLAESESIKELADEYRKLLNRKRIGYRTQKKLKEIAGKSKVNRLEQLIVNCTKQAAEIGIKINDEMEEAGSLMYKDAFGHTMFNVHKTLGMGVNFNLPSARVIKVASNVEWLGATFTERTGYTLDNLTKNIETIIPDLFIQGRNADRLGKEVARQFNMSENAAKRDMRTLTTLITNQASILAYNNCELVEEFEYVATLDGKTSHKCRAMDGKIFKLTEAAPFVNQPPLHYNCRSTTIPYFADLDEFNASDRVARDESGKSYLVGENVTYKDWCTNHAKGLYAKSDKTDWNYTSEKVMAYNRIVDERYKLKMLQADRVTYEESDFVITDINLEQFSEDKINELVEAFDIKAEDDNSVRYNEIVDKIIDETKKRPENSTYSIRGMNKYIVPGTATSIMKDLSYTATDKVDVDRIFDQIVSYSVFDGSVNIARKAAEILEYGDRKFTKVQKEQYDKFCDVIKDAIYNNDGYIKLRNDRIKLFGADIHGIDVYINVAEIFGDDVKKIANTLKKGGKNAEKIIGDIAYGLISLDDNVIYIKEGKTYQNIGTDFQDEIFEQFYNNPTKYTKEDILKIYDAEFRDIYYKLTNNVEYDVNQILKRGEVSKDVLKEKIIEATNKINEYRKKINNNAANGYNFSQAEIMDIVENYRKYYVLVKDNYGILNDVDKNSKVDHIYQQFVKFMGLNKKPETLSTDDFNNFVKENDSIVLYRAVTDAGEESRAGGVTRGKYTRRGILNDLMYGSQQFIGNGFYGQGLYFSNEPTHKQYGNYKGTKEQAIARKAMIQATIKPGTKIIDYDAMQRIANSTLGHNASSDELSLIARIFGYKVIQKGREDEIYYNVIDRDCLIVNDVDKNANKKIDTEAKKINAISKDVKKTNIYGLDFIKMNIDKGSKFLKQITTKSFAQLYLTSKNKNIFEIDVISKYLNAQKEIEEKTTSLNNRKIIETLNNFINEFDKNKDVIIDGVKICELDKENYQELKKYISENNVDKAIESVTNLMSEIENVLEKSDLTKKYEKNFYDKSTTEEIESVERNIIDILSKHAGNEKYVISKDDEKKIVQANDDLKNSWDRTFRGLKYEDSESIVDASDNTKQLLKISIENHILVENDVLSDFFAIQSIQQTTQRMFSEDEFNKIVKKSYEKTINKINKDDIKNFEFNVTVGDKTYKESINIDKIINEKSNAENEMKIINEVVNEVRNKVRKHFEESDVNKTINNIKKTLDNDIDVHSKKFLEILNDALTKEYVSKSVDLKTLERKDSLDYEALQKEAEKNFKYYKSTMQRSKWQNEKLKQKEKISKNNEKYFQQSMKDIFEKTDFCMRLDKNVLPLIANSKFMNQFETGSAPLGLTYNKRRVVAKKMFGIPEDAVAGDYEKYGFVGSKSPIDDFKDDENFNFEYGDTIVRFKKKNLISRTTFTIGDSLFNCLEDEVRSSPCVNPQISSVQMNHVNQVIYGLNVLENSNLQKSYLDIQALTRQKYVELQYHGDVTIDDVESVTFNVENTDVEDEEVKKIIDVMKEHGIRVFLVDSKEETIEEL